MFDLPRNSFQGKKRNEQTINEFLHLILFFYRTASIRAPFAALFSIAF